MEGLLMSKASLAHPRATGWSNLKLNHPETLRLDKAGTLTCVPAFGKLNLRAHL
jgi:hypothetical protein